MRAELNRLAQKLLLGLFCAPDGSVTEAKLFSVAFKCTLLWAFVSGPDRILASWDILSIFVAAMIAPDLLKKMISMRAGLPEEKK